MKGNIEAAYTGRLGQGPELRTSQAGKSWLRLDVAVGQDEDLTWVSTAVSGERAQDLASFPPIVARIGEIRREQRDRA